MELSILSPELDHAVYFRELIHQLAQKFEPLQIFSFSRNSFAKNEQGCFKANEASFHCNYCLLLVTESPTRIDYEVQDFANKHYQQGNITIICHGKQSILEAIQSNNLFFITACTFGKLIYSNNGLMNTDPIPSYIPTNGAVKALKHYHRRMPLADGFLMGAKQCLERGCYNISVFMLHQAVEQTCTALLRVHVGYRAEFHNLNRLLFLCSCFSDKPYNLFFSTSEDKRLFDVLAKSYSCARYKDDFVVSLQDANALYQRVVIFIGLAKTMCGNKIARLKQQANQYSSLKKEREVSDEQV